MEGGLGDGVAKLLTTKLLSALCFLATKLAVDSLSLGRLFFFGTGIKDDGLLSLGLVTFS